ncbi:hypothetical protein NHE_0533 [Neorickettsia helminthoeca str. Oregon]|uniref:Uncharacterized protein n=1 Tax=Neorickettsia helminthoeca str. Oregon TaxID=1286528 RepID=X5H469_9RICK|nr:hypothetical protein NHE_0533 [Neorickettsia helminthoeca str. Oregon]
MIMSRPITDRKILIPKNRDNLVDFSPECTRISSSLFY